MFSYYKVIFFSLLICSLSIFAYSPPQSTALHRAAKTNSPMILLHWLNNGVPVDAIDESGKTPLHWAAINNNEAVTWTLISNGATVNTADYSGHTPLDYCHQPKVAQLLQSRGAKKADRGLAKQLVLKKKHHAVKTYIDPRRLINFTTVRHD